MKKTTNLNIRIGDEVADALNAAAAQAGIAPSTMARIAIENYLKKPAPTSGSTLGGSGEMAIPAAIAEDLYTVAERTMIAPGMIAAMALEKFLTTSTNADGAGLDIAIPEIRDAARIAEHGITSMSRSGKWIGTSSSKPAEKVKRAVMEKPAVKRSAKKDTAGDAVHGDKLVHGNKTVHGGQHAGKR